MRIWLVTVGEPLPIDKGARLLRVGILADLLLDHGHEVVWWSSTFDHNKKVSRFKMVTALDIRPKYKMILLHGTSYKKNVSLRRIVNHRDIARQFNTLASLEQPPDIILSSMPTIELALESSLYGKEHNVPVILDMRDKWPDIFVDVAPNYLKWAIKLLLKPMFSSMNKACSNATAITGITPGFVEWGLSYSGRQKKTTDRDFPLAYSSFSLNENEIAFAEKYWANFGIINNGKHFIACFFGTIRPQIEIETICSAAKILSERGIPVKFVICGGGDNIKYYQDMMTQESNIVFPGWVGKNEMWTLMRIAQVGLAPYRSTADFMMSLPNKVIEYLSAGLPIVSSLKGELASLISCYECGVTYSNDDGADLADGLTKLYENNKLVKKLSSNSIELFNDRFVAEKVYSDMILYLETLANVRYANRQGEACVN